MVKKLRLRDFFIKLLSLSCVNTKTDYLIFWQLSSLNIRGNYNVLKFFIHSGITLCLLTENLPFTLGVLTATS